MKRRHLNPTKLVAWKKTRQLRIDISCVIISAGVSLTQQLCFLFPVSSLLLSIVLLSFLSLI
jgi:hypothetical protein